MLSCLPTAPLVQDLRTGTTTQEFLQRWPGPQGCTPEMPGGGRLPGAAHGATGPLCSLPLVAGQQEPDKDAVVFRVSPSSGLLEARPVNAPPTSVMLQVFFTARYSPSTPLALPRGPQTPPRVLTRPPPTGAVSCMSPRWWWQASLVRRPALCGSGVKALTMSDMCHTTHSEVQPSAPALEVSNMAQTKAHVC